VLLLELLPQEAKDRNGYEILKGMAKMGILPEDIEMMAKFLGRDDPQIRRLLKAYVRDPKIRETVRIILKRRCVKAGFDPDDQPVFLPVQQLPPGEIHVGTVIHGSKPGPEFSLTENALTEHVGIFGHSGTGKSFLAMHLAVQAIKAGCAVWIFDVEDEYSGLNSLVGDGKLITLEPHQLRFNIFEPPGDWIKPTGWLDEVNLFLRGGAFLRDGSLNLFRRGMLNLLRRKGIPEGQGLWPSLLEGVEYFQSLGFGPKSRNEGYLESLLNRIVTMSDFFDQTKTVCHTDMLETLAKRSVIFKLNSLVGIPLQTLVGFLLLWLARFREGAKADKLHLVILEEAHMLASEKSRQDIGENILCRLFRTGRKRDISLMLCDQVPSLLPLAVLGNLGCRIVMRLANSRCIWSVQSSMALDKRQADVLATMEPRRAVVHYSSYPTAFQIEIPQINLPNQPDQRHLYQKAEQLLSNVQCTQYEKHGTKTTASHTKIPAPDDLHGDVYDVMCRICKAPAETIEQRCEFLRIERSREFRARAELDSRGFITKAKQTIAGKTFFFEPTDKGIDWAEKHKIKVKKFKSGIVHEYILSQVEKKIGTTDSKLKMQRNSSVASDQGLQPDLLVLGPDGHRIIVEVCCNNLDYDAKNILAEAAIPHVDHLIAITPDKTTMRKLQDSLKKKNAEDPDGDWNKTITLLDAARCLADNFDWPKVLSYSKRKLFGEKETKQSN
jgi:RecA/RadA recombinase